MYNVQLKWVAKTQACLLNTVQGSGLLTCLIRIAVLKWEIKTVSQMLTTICILLKQVSNQMKTRSEIIKLNLKEPTMNSWCLLQQGEAG